jgi:hypothetical protein
MTPEVMLISMWSQRLYFCLYQDLGLSICSFLQHPSFLLDTELLSSRICPFDHKLKGKLSSSYRSYLLGHSDGPEVASDHTDMTLVTMTGPG